MPSLRPLILLLAVVLGAAFAAIGRAEERGGRAPTIAAHAMVAAADVRAVDAGLEILKEGGSALDAAIAAALVLGLVEPQSSGIGGGGFLLHYDAQSGTIESYDGRETAPAGASADMFLTPEADKRARKDVALGGLPVGVPGLLRLFELAHQAHGRLPWARLFEPAIHQAERGFLISPRLAEAIAETKGLDTFEETRAYFFDAEGKPRRAVERLTNPAYAGILRLVAERGAGAFYSGAVATDLVDAVRGASENPGRIAPVDLEAYQAVRRPPLCLTYRAHLVCGMGPPSSGGTTVLQALKMLERFPLDTYAPGSLEAVHLIAEASRLAFADRDRYLADSDHVDVPLDGLLDTAYLAGRAALIRADRSLGTVPPGAPKGSGMLADAATVPAEGESTSHLVVADAAGNIVTLTASIERAFGSYLMVRGFLLNNELTDFSFTPNENGAPVANRVEPGKRPRSSMSPTLVFDAEGAPLYALGSPGGSRIIGYVLLTLVALIDWQLDIQAAIDLPRVLNRNRETELEQGTSLDQLKPALEALGHEVKLRALTSGLQGIHLRPEHLEGGADPRREGVAKGY
jgi:gamma-glutamyltranspeptidase/glutathione hydrolase